MNTSPQQLENQLDKQCDRSPNVLSQHCPSSNVLKMVAGKWALLVLYALRRETRRYSDLQRRVEGISQKMLTQTLRELERNGLVKRTVYPVVPPHTEYELTELGKSLESVVHGLSLWAQENMREVLFAQEAYDSSKE